MDVSFKYTCGLVNVEQTFHIEFEPNERVDMTQWIIDKATLLEQAGMQPAVTKKPVNLGSPIARAHGANGTHPDDLTPALDAYERQRYCPECQEPLYVKPWVFKSGHRKGLKGKMVVHAKQGSCKFIEFED